MSLHNAMKVYGEMKKEPTYS